MLYLTLKVCEVFSPKLFWIGGLVNGDKKLSVGTDSVPSIKVGES